jgi:hypothetical protein
MSEKDLQDYRTLLHQANKSRLNPEQEEIIEKLMEDGPELMLEEETESTLELPSIWR